jgi:hypothetical protein
MPGQRRQSYQLLLSHQIEPLRDAAGGVYRWVPCMAQPLAWDEVAPASVRRAAAEVCLTLCPALIACEQRRAELAAAAAAGLGGEVRGVWAGRVFTGRGERSADVALYEVTGAAHRPHPGARSLTGRPLGGRRLPPLPGDVYRVI